MDGVRSKETRSSYVWVAAAKRPEEKEGSAELSRLKKYTWSLRSKTIEGFAWNSAEVHGLNETPRKVYLMVNVLSTQASGEIHLLGNEFQSCAWTC